MNGGPYGGVIKERNNNIVGRCERPNSRLLRAVPTLLVLLLLVVVSVVVVMAVPFLVVVLYIGQHGRLSDFFHS